MNDLAVSRASKTRERLARILYRFIIDEDFDLPDRDLILTLIGRYRKYLAEEIIDVNE